MAKTYYRLDADGGIEMSTADANLAAKLGLDMETEVEIVHGCDGRLYIKGTEPAAPAPSVAELRSLEYPSIGDQLDMLYHDMADGTSTWRDAIAAVKEKYPKGQQ
jgi:hypothetical protein